MMDDTENEQRAKYLFKTALKKKELNKMQMELRSASSLTRDAALMSKLKNPAISLDEKAGELAQRLADTSSEVIELISELTGQNRLSDIEDIALEYQRLYDIQRGIEGAEIARITTALPLDDDQLLDIGKKITKLFGKPVIVKAHVNPDIIGGVIIRIGDNVIDGSIAGKLAVLRKELYRGL